MAYTLHKIAAGSYDLEFDGELIGDVVRSPGRPPTWTAELLAEVPRERRPPPFVELEHSFQTLEEVLAWLGSAVVSGGEA